MGLCQCRKTALERVVTVDTAKHLIITKETRLRHSSAALGMLSVTHIMPVLVLLSVVGVGMQQCMIRNQNEMHKFSEVKNGCKYAANNKQF